MKYLSLFSPLVLIFFALPAFSQSDLILPDQLAGKVVRFPTTVLEDGERVPWVLLPEVHVRGYRRFSSAQERLGYRRLEYNVLKVLPYAKLAQEKYDQLQRDLAGTSSKKEQKRLVKNCERDIKSIFNKEVKNLTVTQGKILLKLIDREVDKSSYEMVKELRGGVSAFFYQSLARVFGHNLKNEFDLQQDREIENIIRIHEGLPVYY